MFNSNGSDINKLTILKIVSEEQIFEKYLGIPVEFERQIRNPLRDDINPTCTFRWINNKLYFRDWTEVKAKDCFDVVKLIYQCNFAQAIDIVARDFGLLDGEEHEPKLVKNVRLREPVNLQIKRQDFTKYCTTYWANEGISINTLLKYNVVSLRAVWVRGNKVFDWSPKDLAFAYQFSDNIIKIYFPLRNRKRGQIKFFNTDNSVLEGFTQLPEKGDLLIITKSLKDVMALSEYGIHAVAPASEAIGLNPLVMNILKSRFTNIYSLMDNDWTGRRAAIRLKWQYNIPPIIFPIGEPKDFTDNYKKYGNLYMIDGIEYLKGLYDTSKNYNISNAS